MSNPGLFSLLLLSQLSSFGAEPGMAFIPGGDFSRGRTYDWPDTKLVWYPTVLADDTPVRKITLSPFYLDVYEVTNQRYAVFVKAARRKPPYHWSGGVIPKGMAQRPVHNVSWDDGAAFCAWEGKRLPTEAEWERAARGTAEGLTYPWGSAPPSPGLAVFGLDKGAQDVGTKPKNYFGLHDMIGNVWEWTADWYGRTYYEVASEQDPQGPAEGLYRVLRGGSWFDTPDTFLASSYRSWARHGERSPTIGFRCAKSFRPDLRALVQAAPKLALERSQIKIQAPATDWELGYPSSVAMDVKGDIYVLQRSEKADPILVVDRGGKILRSWGKGLFKIPHTIRIDPQGNVWTVDSSSSMIYKFTPKGEKLMELSVGGQPAGRTGAIGTTDIAFGPNGRLFVSDGYGNARILEYSAKGALVKQWGSPGNGPGQFRQPHSIAIDNQGTIYVADRLNARLQRFDLDGKYLGEWNHLGRVTSVNFTAGNLWIGTQMNNESNESDGWQVKLDRKTGMILGSIASGHGHHVLNVTPSSELLSGARPDIVWYFHKP